MRGVARQLPALEHAPGAIDSECVLVIRSESFFRVRMFMQRANLGQRHTRQRDVIVAVIRDATGPLTVNEILERAQERVPGLGVATVYRTLKLLHEAAKIQTV